MNHVVNTGTGTSGSTATSRRLIATGPGRTTLLATRFLLSLASFLAATVAFAQTPVPAAPLAPGTVTAWTGGSIHTISGDAIEAGTIVARDGRIEAIGRDVSIPADAVVIDVTGRHVYPGLFDANSVLGLTEIGGVREMTDHTEVGNYNPGARVEVTLNADSEILAVTRANGILTAFVTPRGGRVSGQSAVIQLDGWTWEDLTLLSPAGLHLQWPGVGLVQDPAKDLDEQKRARRAAIDELTAQFAAARAYLKAKEAAGSGSGSGGAGKSPSGSDDTSVPGTGLSGGSAASSAGTAGRGSARPAGFEVDARLEAYLPVLRGEIPLVVHADGAREIVSALDWTRDQGLRMILLGGRDAPLVAGRLVEAQVPVIVGDILALPARDYEPYDHRYTVPERLRAAGVRFCIAGEGGAIHERRLPYHAAMAWAYGLPHDEALRAITLYPAEILGLGDRLGSLEVGKDATLIVTDGDPLEITTQVEQAFIEGRKISLANRHAQFYEKYRQRPGAPTPKSQD